MASGGGGQQFGGFGSYGGSSYGGSPFGARPNSFGGGVGFNQSGFRSPMAYGKIGYGTAQPPMSTDNNWYERGQGMPPTQGPSFPPGGIPQMPPAGPQPVNPDIPAGAGNPLYSPRPMMPPGGIPQMPAAPKAPSNPFIPAGVGNPNYSPQTGGEQFSPSAMPVNRAQPAYSGPMFTPGQTLTADQLPQFNDFLKAGGYSLNRPNAYGQPNYGAAGGPGDRYANPNWRGRADNPMAIAPPTNPVTLEQSNPTNPGYNPGDGWRFMLQRYAQDEGRPWDYYLKG